jgi:hypothetical protein
MLFKCGGHTDNPDKLPLTWKSGIDITKNLIDGSTEYELIDRNSGEGQGCYGGPRCTNNGKEIPCFVYSSPKASITSEGLAKMLETIDSYHLFDRSNGKMPFLLLNG